MAAEDALGVVHFVFIVFLPGMTKGLANYPPVPCFLHFVARAATLAGAADMMKPSKNQTLRGNQMNIAKHMEAIFVATLLVLGGINMATAKAIRPAPVLSPADEAAEATSVIPELPYLVVAANM